MCWHGCELPALCVCAGITVLTPKGGAHAGVLTWRGPVTPIEPVWGGCSSQDTTVEGGVQPCHCSDHHHGAANHRKLWRPPIGAQATIPNWAESSSQLGFCKQPRCPLYNLFTGAWGRSGQGACEERHVERIYLVCQFPSPAKGPQAEICTPSCPTGCPALALALTSGT